MADEQNRRASDAGLAGQVRAHSTTFWDWADKRKIAAHAVIGITLYLTVEVIKWAMWFADEHVARDSNSVALIIGAVLTPWGIMQGAMFKFYIDLMKSNGNGHVG